MEKILVVDDDESVRKMITMRLSDVYEIIDTGDPLRALELALRHRPRAILLDLMMPDCSGFELCQVLKSLNYTGHVPIFVVTGETAARYKTYMTTLGATGYIEKPIDFTYLRDRLAAELKKGPVERRAHVRVRMKIVLKLKGVDSQQRSFEQLITTENVSAGGFLCPLLLVLSPQSTFQVFLSGSGDDHYVGRVRIVRVEARQTLLQRYAFQFIERTAEWILQG